LTYKFPPLIRGIFVERRNRFAALVEVRGRREKVFVPNSGRLKELLAPGAEVFLAEKKASHRVTAYDLALVRHGERLVSVDAHLPNKVVEQALRQGLLEPFAGWEEINREYNYGHSRIDFRLRFVNQACFIEVKSVTLVNDGTAMFPDAPTARGTKHLQELAGAVAEGYRAAALFLIQRDDARAFAPNDATDPVFGAALRAAAGAGVEVYAYRCRVTLEGISVEGQVPVKLQL
jgi:sugar fermentation stimulation protein A